MAKIISAGEFQTEVLDKKGVVLVDFFATWCGPCKSLGPILEKLSEDASIKAEIVKVDIDQSVELARQFQVMSVPTMKIFKNGEVVDSIVGLRPESELREKLNYFTAG